MSKYVNDMWPGSPQKDSPSTSRSSQSSRLSSRSRSRSFSRSSRSDSHVSSRSSSRSRSRLHRRSRSRSRSRRRHQRKYRRYSRSYSQSRSRSRARRYRERRYERSRRYYRSPSPYRSRSRSRSRGRSYYRRASALTRGRRYYGFGRTVYPEESSRRRERSRTRSRSRTPFRLSEKDRMELLEIAKANAAKALGTTNFDLPASLKIVSGAKETSHGTGVPNDAKFELSVKLTEDGTKNLSERLSQQRTIAFSSANSVAKPIPTSDKAAGATSSGSPKIDLKKSPYGLWIPV
ncbi:arginine/serine-rich protein 1 isoform X1 [Tupaia chinensis]|uniref:arginine/serine-rich protein 1 isoform X1 n=1 Tax=Tupaia chinensis TaxID=246437 RepID=UPI0003C8DE9E|nr:arginine/serine-rich protein 1 isoform X1 [Tupaia chinensis]